jgi:hypothetical protein
MQFGLDDTSGATYTPMTSLACLRPKWPRRRINNIHLTTTWQIPLSFWIVAETG